MAEIIRGTTPKLIFTSTDEFDLSSLVEIWFTLKQNSSGMEITHTLSDGNVEVDSEAKTITMSLTQEETLKFDSTKAEVQIRVLDNSDLSYSTDIFTINLGRILKDGVINA